MPCPWVSTAPTCASSAWVRRCSGGGAAVELSSASGPGKPAARWRRQAAAKPGQLCGCATWPVAPLWGGALAHWGNKRLSRRHPPTLPPSLPPASQRPTCALWTSPGACSTRQPSGCTQQPSTTPGCMGWSTERSCLPACSPGCALCMRSLPGAVPAARPAPKLPAVLAGTRLSTRCAAVPRFSTPAGARAPRPPAVPSPTPLLPLRRPLQGQCVFERGHWECSTRVVRHRLASALCLSSTIWTDSLAITEALQRSNSSCAATPAGVCSAYGAPYTFDVFLTIKGGARGGACRGRGKACGRCVRPLRAAVACGQPPARPSSPAASRAAEAPRPSRPPPTPPAPPLCRAPLPAVDPAGQPGPQPHVCASGSGRPGVLPHRSMRRAQACHCRLYACPGGSSPAPTACAALCSRAAS